MNYKLDYVTRVFAKTNKKRIENYVISRIWHLLNDDEIKIVHQQYVSRDKGNYALTDLFLPQINYHIEVNEEFHYTDENKILLDKKRQQDIIRNTKGHTITCVDCRENLANIHKRVDEIVNEIKDKIEEKKASNSFLAWQEDELTPEYWIKRGVINVDDNVNLRTIDDIGKLFNVKITNRGFLKAGAASYDKDGYSDIWWPSQVKRHNWVNLFDEDFNRVTERNEIKMKDNSNAVSRFKNNPNFKRVVLYKYRDELGFDFYKFVGGYKLNFDASLRENQLVWERFTKTCEIRH